jgi:hypothetical protein
MSELIDEIRGIFTAEPDINVFECESVGSRATCNPPVLDTDRDVLVLIENCVLAGEACDRLGFVTSSSLLDQEARAMMFVSVKRDELNLIITDSQEFYRRFLAARSIAKRLNLREKSDRIALFQAVLYGQKAA